MFTYSGQCQKCINCDCHQKSLSVITNNPLITTSKCSRYYSTVTNSAERHSVHFNCSAMKMGPKSAATSCGQPGQPRKSILCSSNSNHREENRRTTVQRKSEPFRKYCGAASRIFEAPPIIQSKTKSITSAVRDYGSNSFRNFVVVPQAVQLYDENPTGDIRISREEFDKLVAHAYKNGSRDEIIKNGRKCTELDQPKFNSIRKSVKDIQVAIGNLQKIPNEIEEVVQKDPIMKQKIKAAVTKKMNFPSKSRLYQELISIETPEAERQKSAEEILKGMKALQPPPKSKDPEPNILNFNEPKFSRIKPKLPDPPPKPTKGVSSNVSEDYQLIISEHEFSEKDSNASVFQLPFTPQ